MHGYATAKAGAAHGTAPSPPAIALVATCFVLSGASALIFQVAWARQFAVLFGTSEMAIAAVLAAFMGGLAFGAWIASAAAGRISRPLRVYALLELGLAAFGVLLTPVLIWLLSIGVTALLGGQAAAPNGVDSAAAAFFFLGAFLVMGAPAALMGATLPILLRFAVIEDRQVGSRTGLLYAANTAGGVAGALATAILLLPLLGVARTTWVAGAFSILSSIAALYLSSTLQSGASAREKEAAVPPRRPIAFAEATILGVMLASGMISFLHEVLWTRLLSHVMGGSIRSFGVMLATFLAGIAIGGFVGGVLARRRDRAILALAVTQFAIAIFAVFAWRRLGGPLPDPSSSLAQLWYCFKVMFPIALFIGATFPLAVRAVTSDPAEAARRGALVYSWNTVGCVAGALLASLFVIPQLRYEGAMHLAVLGSAALACVVAILFLRTRRLYAGAVILAAIVLSLWFRPSPPTALVRHSPLLGAGAGDVAFYGVGRSADVVLLAQDGGLYLRSNGLPEASIDRLGAPPYHFGEAWMAPLAGMARPQARSLLIVGLGSGRTVLHTPQTVRAIDIIELEPRVVAANRLVAGVRPADPLADPRVRLVENDARGALMLTSKRYDLVISQPSHPWTAGASHLFTREFLELVRGHLTPGGLFVQWIGIDYLDAPLLRAFVATAVSTFEEVRVYRPSAGTLVLLASDAPIDPEQGWAAFRSARELRSAGIGTLEDVASALVLDTGAARAFARGARPVTDDRNLFATTPVIGSGRRLSESAASALLLPQNAMPRLIEEYRESGRPVSAAYIARRLLLFAPRDESNRMLAASLAALMPGDEAAALRAETAKAAGDFAGADRLLSDALRRYPNSDTIVFEQIAQDRDGVSAGRMSGEAGMIADAMAAAARGDWRHVESLDSSLAAVPPIARWAVAAVRLRAAWRVNANQGARARAREAIEIVDAVVAAQPDIELLWLRMQAGIVSQDADVVIQSGIALARLARSQRDGLSPAQKGRALAVLHAASDSLWPMLVAHDGASARALRTRQRLDAAAQYLVTPPDDRDRR